MEAQQIRQLMEDRVFKNGDGKPSLIETHISWVILSGECAYKIKKPLRFSFLDFSTLEQRKYYCEREVVLNKRLAGSMYIKAIPIYENSGVFSLNSENGNVVDYAVLMKRMDPEREMDKLLDNNTVSRHHILKLAAKIAAFHKRADVLKGSFKKEELRQKFNDIRSIAELADRNLGVGFSAIIARAIDRSDQFLDDHQAYLTERSVTGFIRDIHGDLHCGNIFLYEDPVVFDCIEFNNSLRQIDVLNEVGFLCMDMHARGRNDLAEAFYQYYMLFSEMEQTDNSRQLFHYYKCYGSNVRAKVGILNGAEVADKAKRLKKMDEAKRYLTLMKEYLSEF